MQSHSSSSTFSTHLSLGVGDDLARDAPHAGHGAADDGGGGQGTEELRLRSQRSSRNLSRKIAACSQRCTKTYRCVWKAWTGSLTMAGLMDSPAVWSAAKGMLDWEMVGGEQVTWAPVTCVCWGGTCCTGVCSGWKEAAWGWKTVCGVVCSWGWTEFRTVAAEIKCRVVC